MREDADLLRIAQRLVPGGRVRRRWPLDGGVSAVIQALEIEPPEGPSRRVVVRRPGGADFKSPETGDAATEFALLEALHAAGMEVPRVLLLDEPPGLESPPSVVMEFVDGTTTIATDALPEALTQMAEFLARLHALDAEDSHWPRLPPREDPRSCLWDALPAGPLTEQIRDALARTTPPPAPRPSLLHGDFWPGNILWMNGRLAAVIDWEDAAFGDPVSDLACARVELLCEYGHEAMTTFTQHYRAMTKTDPIGLPLWDLYVSATALASMAQWGLDPEVERTRRRITESFEHHAIDRLLHPS